MRRRGSRKRSEEEEEEEIFEVEAIINHRIRNGKKQYLLRWKSFSDGEATWEDEKNLSCPEILAEYKAKCESLMEMKVRQKIAQNVLKDAHSIRMKQPEIVISAYKDGGILFYRVGCKNPPSFLSMPADELRKVRPDLICNFLENKIVVRNEDEEAEKSSLTNNEKVINTEIQHKEITGQVVTI
ncbi:Chromobox protein 1 [Tritrichomonas foetus]|uniref:Chromobox protein 1 n=1 Tax=Tritrichomonas foetus TaxID=1144522 RepID=A0A1J4JF25_9EUKA|nr:Chromobox protein 1 [Tritrichomonas foetus]|eukprot:OHS96053.1 Chromobox protein 1 [Tritrichomonas foetus]